MLQTKGVCITRIKGHHMPKIKNNQTKHLPKRLKKQCKPCLVVLALHQKLLQFH